MAHQAIDRRAYPGGMLLWAWAAPDGWMHRRLDWPQPDGERPRGSLLFAGGRGDFVEKYLEAMTEWHRQGWSVASFDWRGQGKSKVGATASRLQRFDTMVEDLGALIADWRAATPGPHVVVAHSMGGHLMLRVLVAGQAKIDAAVLVAPMIEVNSGIVPPRLARAIASAATRLGLGARPLWGAPLARAPAGSKRQRALTGCVQRYEDELYWWDMEKDHAPTAPTFGWLHEAYSSARHFRPEALARVNVPVLLIGADRDELVSAAAIRRAAGLMPMAELVMFPDCAHEILRERDAVRAEAMARIDRFLAERLA